MAGAGPDVMRRRRGMMTEYLGGLFASKPAVREPFELGFAAMNACRWDEAIVHLQKAAVATKGLKLVALLNLIGVCHYTRGPPERRAQGLRGIGPAGSEVRETSGAERGHSAISGSSTATTGNSTARSTTSRKRWR